jgi:hypothetical protein
MDSRRDQIAGQLRGAVTGTTEGAINGGGYTFDPDTIKQVIKNWVELANSYAQSAAEARPMARIGPPGDEFVSKSFADKANASGESYISYCIHNADICTHEAQRYQDALDAYLGAEERTIIKIGKADDDPSTPLG